MRNRIQKLLSAAMLVLAAGCASGAGMATDLPKPRYFPSYAPVGPDGSGGPDRVVVPANHPPDGLVVAREPGPKWSKDLDATLARTVPAAAVVWLGLVLMF